MYQKLNIPTDELVPEGYELVLAYAKGSAVVLPIDVRELAREDQHNCDWEGCSSVSHVVRFDLVDKYKTEDMLIAKNEKINELSMKIAILEQKLEEYEKIEKLILAIQKKNRG